MLRKLTVMMGEDGVRASAIAYGNIVEALGHDAGGQVPDDVDRDVTAAVLEVVNSGVCDPERLTHRALARLRKTNRGRAHASALADAFVRGDDRPPKALRAVASGEQTPLDWPQSNTSPSNDAAPARTIENIGLFLYAHTVLKAFNEACALAPPPLSQRKRDFLAHSISVLAGIGETDAARLRDGALAELASFRDHRAT
jgi:hypothetical protein